MIFVDRSAVPVPEVLVEQGMRELDRAADFYAIPHEERRQQRFMWKAYAAREVRDALDVLFHGKCAYCESRILTVARPDIEHYRPKGGVVRPDGTLLPDHYWWLAVEWSNLLIACPQCGRMSGTASQELAGKGSRFPLADEERRAPALARGEELLLEHPLLLDPCASRPEDRPERHLVFYEDGSVASDTPQGQTTIEVLQLNRSALVEARQDAARRLRLELDVAERLAGYQDDDALEAQLKNIATFADASQEYAGLKRQLIGASLSGLHRDEQIPEGVAVSKQRARRAKFSQRRFADAQQSYSLTDASDAELFRSMARRVERVVIRNVRAIQHADLDLSQSAAKSAPWTVLLGENGTGKSTVLQALAVALIGEEEVRRLGLRSPDFIRRAPRVTQGTVEVYLSGSRRSRRVVFGPDGFEFVRSSEPQTLVLGYGETRMLPNPDLRSATGTATSRVEGLFRPARSLVDVEAWLLEASDEDFDYVGGAIQDLLNIPRSQWLDRSEGRVRVLERGGPLSLSALSTGYQSVLATVIDILSLVLDWWPTPDSAEGIVLMDELGAHLHPTWRMRIVTGLRDMLPSMQFVATTHEPLCLRGLGDHEVVLMERDTLERAHATTDLPSPQDLRVDQLLTSRYFGLSTTLDPDLDAKFSEYYELLSYEDGDLSVEQRHTRDELAGQLLNQGVLGYTRRDQLVYEAIDEFLAQERQAGRRHRPSPISRAQTLKRVRELWGLANLAEQVGEGTA